MRQKIFRSMALLACITVIVSSVVSVSILTFRHYEMMKLEIRNEAYYLKTAVELNGADYFTDLSAMDFTMRKSAGQISNTRITLLNPDGDVLVDTLRPGETLDNHLDREEVREALTDGTGEAVRLSKTLGKQTFYYALCLDNGLVLRVSTTTDSVYYNILSYVPYILLCIGLLLIMALFLAEWLVRRIVIPINSLDLDEPSANEIYDELTPLLSRISHQQEQIQQQMRQLAERQLQFVTLTEHMNEGMLLIGEKGQIITLNKQARNIFGIKDESLYREQHFLLLHRSIPVQQLLEAALHGESGEVILPLKGQQYQVMATPVFSEERDLRAENVTEHPGAEIQGVVLLVLDITEREHREQLRREFTANVSHELKTPLTSISGYAEIMQQGIVRLEDIPRFAGKIYEEANHLIALVSDIIKLSRLDENKVDLPIVPVDLLCLVKNAAQRLQTLAQQHSVKVEVSGEALLVQGVPSLLDEMVYNMTENAIKYNQPQGQVQLIVEQSLLGPRLIVKDTGIGIALEDQERVFERFYRVDKSHWKETGGTGLGLSIVKHGAMFHKAQLTLESKIGEGTTITLLFPAKNIEAPS